MIKIDMGMPEYCYVCRLYDHDWGFCRATKDQNRPWSALDRPSWCPLKEGCENCYYMTWDEGVEGIEDLFRM